MKKLSFIVILALILVLACSGMVFGAQYPLAGQAEKQEVTGPDGSTFEMEVFTVDPEAFTAALEKAAPNDDLTLDVFYGPKSYYGFDIRADLLEAAAKKGVWVVTPWTQGDAYYGRTIPSLNEDIARLFPGAKPEDVTVHYHLDYDIVGDIQKQRSDIIMKDARKNHIVVSTDYDDCSDFSQGTFMDQLLVFLIYKDQVVLMDSLSRPSYYYYYSKSAEPMGDLCFAVDQKGWFRVSKESIIPGPEMGEGLYQHSWKLNGSCAQLWGDIDESAFNIPGVAGHWSESHYRAQFKYGAFLNLLGEDNAGLSPQSKLNRTQLSAIMLNAFNIQPPGEMQVKAMEAANQAPPDMIAHYENVPEEFLPLLITYDVNFGPSMEEIQAIAEKGGKAPPATYDGPVPRALVINDLYNYVPSILGDNITLAEADKLLAGSSPLEGEFASAERNRLAWGYAIKHGWVCGDPSGNLRMMDDILCCEFIKIMDLVGGEIAMGMLKGEF